MIKSYIKKLLDGIRYEKDKTCVVSECVEYIDKMLVQTSLLAYTHMNTQLLASTWSGASERSLTLKVRVRA